MPWRYLRVFFLTALQLVLDVDNTEMCNVLHLSMWFLLNAIVAERFATFHSQIYILCILAADSQHHEKLE